MKALPTRYPIYVISKGRADTRMTAKAFDRMGIDYRLVIEPQEFEAYANAMPAPSRILLLPSESYGGGCSIPARNFCWDHSLNAGHARHWVVDDNIKRFTRLNRNEKVTVSQGSAIFRAMEDFVDRYENVALAGPNYQWLTKAMQQLPAFYLNTRIYSCILIDNALPHRWRGRYNEDTDLSLRCLKDGLCTVLFNAFGADKALTMTMKGGNTDLLYAEGQESRRRMTESLIAQHPDVVRMTEKFGHPHHQVNYKPFRRNKLRLKPGVVQPSGTNDYGMELKKLQKDS